MKEIEENVTAQDSGGLNFVEQYIKEDLAAGKNGEDSTHVFRLSQTVICI